ncbi:hypothetical protein BpHYR1_043522 [Brachionus plicatilis]|uniref:Uncharacterized protein n=1 Tax=Brachionus plicatilis TaxID=10195 RepID=A0A3M7R8Y5_BRAPC|nr:hypothetical protein BpHYR1_043522 [Brachionus plicatilis]
MEKFNPENTENNHTKFCEIENLVKSSNASSILSNSSKRKSPSSINRDRIKSSILRAKIIYCAVNKIIDLKTEDFKRLIENSNILPEEVLLNKSVQNRNIIYDFDSSKIKIEFDEQKMEDFESHFLDNYYDIVKENRLKSSLKFASLNQKLDELKNKLQTEEKSSSSNKNQLEQIIPTKSPIVNMGRQIPSTLEKQLKSRLGEDTQSGETSESESEMVEGRTISTLTTITEETVTEPDATTSSEAIARQSNVPGGSNQNDMVDEEPEEEEEDFIPPEEILKQQLMSEFKRNSKFDLRDVEYFINDIIGHKFEDGKLKLLLKWDKVGKREYHDS